MTTPDAPLDRSTLHGVGLRLLAELDGADTLPDLPGATTTVLDLFADQLQPQIGPLGADVRVRSWVNAAAVVEAHGFHDLAVDLIEGLRRVIVGEHAADEARAFDAFLWTRRGRIARLAAQLDDAEECYREALRRTPQSRTNLWWEDVVSNAWIGLSVLAVARGNYPLAQQEAKKLLVPQVPSTQQVQGHLLLALILRKRGKPGVALVHLWQAFDLLDGTDPRRADVLVTLGEIAGEVGEWESALHARLAALAVPILPRVAAAALSGVLSVLAQPVSRTNEAAEVIIARSAWGQRVLAKRPERNTAARAEGHARNLLRPQADHVQPSVGGLDAGPGALTAHDQVVLGLSLAELIAAEGRYREANEWLRLAEALAVSHGFHERQFQIDALRSAWAAQGSSLHEPRLSAPPISPLRRTRHATVWQRMNRLEEMAVSGGGVG